MTRAALMVATVLAMTGAASAQAPKAGAPPAPMTLRPGWTAPKPPAATPTTTAAFGCEARAPNICRFRIFFARGDRVVTLPAGTKDKVPGVTIGGAYCMTVGKTPPFDCPRKTINATYNS
jgi:hypothetical protein